MQPYLFRNLKNHFFFFDKLFLLGGGVFTLPQTTSIVNKPIITNAIGITIAIINPAENPLLLFFLIFFVLFAEFIFVSILTYSENFWITVLI